MCHDLTDQKIQKIGPNVTKKSFISTSAFRKHGEQKHAIALYNQRRSIDMMSLFIMDQDEHRHFIFFTTQRQYYARQQKIHVMMRSSSSTNHKLYFAKL